ncbi:MAG: hypothetical protein J7L03_06035 [Caldisericaceae bacterium]|nr:hypothetical protein [Caldisericaceae bacterium]
MNGNLPTGNLPLNGLNIAGAAGAYGIVLVLLLVFAIATAVVAGKKGRNAFGWFFIGLFTGIFGLAIALAILPKKYYVDESEDF